MLSDIIHKSHLTAIHRRSLPAPVRWIIEKEIILEYTTDISILDFGCGKCATINPPHWDSYDPYYQPDGIKKKKYNIILCTYVLCVLPRGQRLKVLKRIQSLLSKNGIAYISVRNDQPKQGWGLSKRKTYQGRANLSIPLIYSNSQFRIYLLTKTNKLG